jgi:hypothetical protein
MAHIIAPFLLRDLNLFPGDNRASERSAEEVDSFVEAVCFYAGKDGFVDEFFADVLLRSQRVERSKRVCVERGKESVSTRLGLK